MASIVFYTTTALIVSILGLLTGVPANLAGDMIGLSSRRLRELGVRGTC
jgi:hypothetical protein